MKDIHGQEYRYAHDEPGAYAAGEKYLPPEMGEAILFPQQNEA
ncbi:hypothetical protein OH492_19625 [Vibrio chagasii]|nr:hypothetical protein [Vibrio chagasii]